METDRTAEGNPHLPEMRWREAAPERTRSPIKSTHATNTKRPQFLVEPAFKADQPLTPRHDPPALGPIQGIQTLEVATHRQDIHSFFAASGRPRAKWRAELTRMTRFQPRFRTISPMATASSWVSRQAGRR